MLHWRTQQGPNSVDLFTMEPIQVEQLAAEETRAPSRSGARGFTLIEFMVGLVIAILGLGGIVQLTVANSRLRRVDQEVSYANVAIRKKLEEIREASFSTVPGLNGTGFMVDVQGDGRPDLQPVPGDSDGLPGSITVATEAASGSEVLYRVTVTVLWQGIAGRRQVSQMTLVANRWGQ